MAASPPSHLEAVLQHDIDLIRAKLLEMLTLDEQALTRACYAFLKRDRQLAYSVILRDQDVDALDTMVDRLCLEFILRHQPVGANLRFVYSASKIVNMLERVGDYAESIARQVLLISALNYEVPADKFKEIANLAIPMLHNAVHAFVDRNENLARTTMASEPRVNQIRDILTSDLADLREQGRLPTEALTPLITVARRFERVSDQATNICEQALYFATGESLRHMPREGFRVLFVDQSNGCLSRIAEAVAASLGAPRFTFDSAGIVAGAVEPHTIRFLAGKGIDVSQKPSKSIEQVQNVGQLEVVVALSKEAEKAFPLKPSKTLGLLWAVRDPSEARGMPEEIEAEYERAYAQLGNHVRDLVQAILGDGPNTVHQGQR
ncbi:MAG TPA: phosphate signaling complex protein PhoU [Candidatus Acidoferrales bacterium]|nr:phosphate signaling complex protein PhoU [Candidatus Acidoferrales bacterium]